MRVKTFEATSMQEALNVVKQDMGEEAFILSTRTQSPQGPPWVRARRLSSRSPPRWTTRRPPPVRAPAPCR